MYTLTREGDDTVLSLRPSRATQAVYIGAALLTAGYLALGWDNLLGGFHDSRVPFVVPAIILVVLVTTAGALVGAAGQRECVRVSRRRIRVQTWVLGFPVRDRLLHAEGLRFARSPVLTLRFRGFAPTLRVGAVRFARHHSVTLDDANELVGKLNAALSIDRTAEQALQTDAP